jgi:hypothetical protein
MERNWMRLHRLLIASTILVGSTAIAQDFDFFGFADSDRDGKVTLAEYSAFREGGWSYFFSGKESVSLASAPDMSKNALAGSPVDAEGNVTHAAYTAAAPELFKKADANGDGALDKGEMTASMGGGNG